VAAFVVTYRRPDLLRAVLIGVAAQSRQPDAVIVLNNDPAGRIRDGLEEEFPGIGIVDLAENGGSAGGFARALHLLQRCGYTWGWLLDDDSVPEPTALEELLAASARLRDAGRHAGILSPMQVSARGPFGGARWRHRIVEIPDRLRRGVEPFEIDLAYWAGMLVHRDVVARVGLPRLEFFRCYADYEYCLRARRVGTEIIAVPMSRVAHHDGLYRRVVRFGRPSVRTGYSPARYYYDARNAVFTAWHTLRSPVAVVFHVIRQCRLAIGDLLYEDQWLRRIGLRLRGTADGLLGRMGRRPEVE
jgi:GT2 family glycosyltransferase